MREFSIFSITFIFALCVFPLLAQAQWVKKMPPTQVNLFGVDMVGPQQAYALGWANGSSTLLYTHNNGQSWKKMDMDMTYMFDVNFQDTANGFIAGHDIDCGCGLIRHTTDGGQNWTDIRTALSFGLYKVQMMPDGKTGFSCGYSGRILKTTDAWAHIDSMPTGNGGLVFRNMYMVNKDTGYAIGGRDFTIMDKIYRTTDGQRWQLVNDMTGKISISGMYFRNGREGFITGNDGKDIILYTNDMAASFTQVFSRSLASELVTAIDMSGDYGYACTTDGILLKSTDGGMHWVTETVTGSKGYLSNLAMYNERSGIAVGQMGYTLMRSSTSGLEHSESSNSLSGISLYPNPVWDAAWLQLYSPGVQPYQVSIYDLQGRQMQISAQGTFTIGQQKIRLNTEALDPGCYLVQIASPDGVHRQVLAKQ